MNYPVFNSLGILLVFLWCFLLLTKASAQEIETDTQDDDDTQTGEQTDSDTIEPESTVDEDTTLKPKPPETNITPITTEEKKPKQSTVKRDKNKDPYDKKPKNKKPKNKEPKNKKPIYETVVTASRSEMNKFEAPRSIDLIQRDRIDEKQARSVPEQLNESTGVHVQQTNRGSGSPIIRGLIGPQNLILLDNVRFNTSTFRTGPNQYLAMISPHAVERIEIIRGPASVLYGNGAMGGVLHLITFSPNIKKRNGNSGFLRTWASSADTAPGGAFQLVAKSQELALLGGAGYSYFGNLRIGGGEVLPFTDYQVGTWRAKAIYKPKKKKYTITGAYFGTKTNDAGRTDKLGRGDVRFYDNTDHLAYLSYNLKGKKKTLEYMRLDLSYHRMDEQVERYQCEKGADGLVSNLTGCKTLKDEYLTQKRYYDDQVNTIGANLDTSLILFSEKVRLTGGGEFYNDFVGSSLSSGLADDDFGVRPSVRGNFSDNSKYLTLGFYLHTDITIWDFGEVLGEIHAFGGGRFSLFSAHAPNVPGLGDVNYQYQGMTGAAGLQWLRHDLFNLYTSFTQGMRAPNLQETTVLGDTGSKFEIPNDELGPERSNTIEVGGRLFFDWMSLEANYFYSYLTDAIDEEAAEYEGQNEIDGALVVQRVNAQNGKYQGIETSVEFNFWRFALTNRLTWMTAEITTADGTHPARRIPPVFGVAALRYTHTNEVFFTEFFTKWSRAQDQLHPNDKQDLRICEEGNFSGVLKDPCNGTEGWYTLNLRGSIHFSKKYRVEISLMNLADKRYKPHASGLHAPGFDARGTFIVNF